MKRYSLLVLSFTGMLLIPSIGLGQSSDQRLELDRKGETIILEPYAPNILRVTLSLQRDNALAKPGYGFVGTPNAEGWSKTQTDLNDVYQSFRIIATVERDHPPLHPPLQTELDIKKYFNGSTPGSHITITTPEGKKLLEMTGWQQAVPNHKDGTASVNNDRRPTDPEFFTVGATFASPDDEHYYGLGENHEGFLDHRGHPVRCWNDYPRPPRPPSAFRFWSPTRATASSGTTPRRPPSSPVSTSRPNGRRKSATVSLSSSSPAAPPTKSTQATASSPAQRRCCPKRPTATSSASSATPARMKFSPLPRVIVTAIFPLMSWSSTGSTTPKWARWTWIRSSGPIPPR